MTTVVQSFDPLSGAGRWEDLFDFPSDPLPRGLFLKKNERRLGHRLS
jgi:hypothetical protein